MAKKKVLLIVNPTSGKNKGRAGTFDIVNRFSSADYDFTIKPTTCQGDATNIVKKYIDGNDMVVCCGGDGTFNETINGVMSLNRRVPIGYIPAGSTNDLAHTIGLPTKINEATETIIEGNINQYDIGLFNNRFFSYIASFGVGTNLAYQTPQKLKNKFGHGAYMLDAFVIHLIPTIKSVKPKHCRIEYDGKVLEDDFFFGSISNTTSVAGMFNFDRNEVRLDDGKFEVLLVRGVSNPFESFPLLAQIRKMDYDGKKIIYFRCSSLRMTFSEPVPWTLDGEFGGDQTNVNFSVLNRAIDIVSGPNSLFAGPEIDIPVYESEAVKKEKEKEKEKKSRFKKKDKEKNTEEAAPEAEEAETTVEEDVVEATAAPEEEAAESEDKASKFSRKKKDKDSGKEEA